MAPAWPWRALVHYTLAILATIVFALLGDAVLGGRTDDLDLDIALAIHEHGRPSLDLVMIAITHVGSWPSLFVLVVAVSFWLLRHGDRWTPAILVASALVAQLANVVLKHMFARPRPTLFEVIPLPASFSFPSGHAMSATVLLGSVAAVLIALHPARRVPILVVTAVLVFAIGLSRVYLGVHWPSDVIAGFAAGVPLLVAAVQLLHAHDHRR